MTYIPKTATVLCCSEFATRLTSEILVQYGIRVSRTRQSDPDCDLVRPRFGRWGAAHGEEMRFIVEVEVRTATNHRIMNILDEVQRRQYAQLLGKEFDTSTIHLGGGPPPRPRPKGPPSDE